MKWEDVWCVGKGNDTATGTASAGTATETGTATGTETAAAETSTSAASAGLVRGGGSDGWSASTKVVLSLTAFWVLGGMTVAGVAV